MKRRKAIIAADSAITAALAGCTNSNSESPDSEEQQPVDVEVKFSVQESTLVAVHEEGDVLQSGQDIYVTVGGESVKEYTLNESVHAGGEIIRVEGLDEDYSGEVTVGLYLDRPDEPVEVAVGEVSFESPIPNIQFDFDYRANENSLTITHTGGGSVDADTISVNVDGTERSVSDRSGKFSAGDVIWSGNASSSAEVIWRSPDGDTSQTIAIWEAP